MSVHTSRMMRYKLTGKGVVHAAVLAGHREERGRWAGEEVPHVKAVDDAAGLAN